MIEQTLSELDRLLAWGPKWNSYDVPAPNPKAIAATRVWLQRIYPLIEQAGLQWEKPTSLPDGDEIDIFWYHGVRKLNIYVGEQTVEYLQVWKEEVNSEMTDGDIESDEDFLKLYRWLLEEEQ